jgi:nitrite reductase (NADH) small subunit
MRFQRVGRTVDVPMLEGRATTVGGRRVAIFRTPDGWFALGAQCPHEDGPLEDGLVAEACVTCPLHNWRLDLNTGRVISGGEGSVPVYKVLECVGELLLGVDEAGLPVARAPELEPAA